MMASQEPTLRGTLKINEPMSRHTTWRVGGPAERYYEPADLDDLALFLSRTDENEPLMWLGLGSNLLVRDGGIKGTVVVTTGLLNGIRMLGDDVLRAEAGVACAKVARFASRHGLVGAEFLAGIPGTMGGALAMNAGAFGGETWPHVTAVEVMDRFGQRYVRKPDEYEVAYRSVNGPEGEWFVAAHLSLTIGDAETASARVKELLEKRGATQPIGLPSCGSVFRNPENEYAARLIEECGLKGTFIGGACVSEKHANFIINSDHATAKDIELLIEKVAHTVEQQYGVKLIREVHIVGEAKV
ncbi:UDP-N-acetylmuramate dehydrogenase [Pseudomonadota bacterium]